MSMRNTREDFWRDLDQDMAALAEESEKLLAQGYLLPQAAQHLHVSTRFLRRMRDRHLKK